MELQQIIRIYAPILHFHPEEGDHCCFPSDAELVFKRFHNNWDQFKENKTPKNLDDKAPCYFETWEDTDLMQIRYWIWYNYNDFPGGRMGLGKHLGDWEHIEVRIFNERDVVWLLSNHRSARAALERGTFPGLISEGAILDDRHIHAWVALGSHAHYPSPLSEPRCYARVFCDKIADGGPIWSTEDVLKPLHETNFRNFVERWGDEGAPRSPLNQYNNRWRNADDVRPI